MRAVGITGGIGSGKSYVCKHLESAGYPVFYCDDEAKRIIRTHPEVKQTLRALVGDTLYTADGILQKSVLAAFLCRGKAYSAQVDAIVHPRVAEAFRQWCAMQTTSLVFMECALLFETGFDRLVDCAVLVGVDEYVRLQRVMQRDNITEQVARKWMALQMPEEEKRERAHYVINNNIGCDINEQIAKMVNQISK